MSEIDINEVNRRVELHKKKMHRIYVGLRRRGILYMTIGMLMFFLMFINKYFIVLSGFFFCLSASCFNRYWKASAWYEKDKDKDYQQLFYLKDERNPK